MTESSNHNLSWISLLIFNCLVYGLCCLLIIKRKTFTYISIRSPTLLLITNFSNFLMSLAIIIYKLTDSNFISIIYYIFRIAMILSILIRYERILTCFNINIDNYYKKRYLLQEKFYVRILGIAFFAIFLLIIIINLIGNKCFELFYISNVSSNKSIKSKIYMWIIWNFMEQFAIITYIFRLYDKKIKNYLSLELLVFSVLSILYTNYSSIIFLNKSIDNSEFIVITLIVLYLYLILNGLFPIIMSFFSKANICYYFTPRLTNSLYLFLANEECYESFNDYLTTTKDKNGSFYLKLYTHIMKYKLDHALNIGKNELFNEANEIYNNYFNSENHLEQINQEIMTNVRDQCQILKLNSYTNQMFDDALQFTFGELNKRFIQYKESNEFIELQEDINLYTFIQCKMCNSGLINKF